MTSRALRSLVIAFGLGSSALAGNFNASINLPVYPTFSVGASLSQSFELAPNLSAAVGLNTRYTPSTNATSADAFANLELEAELARDASTRTAAYFVPGARFNLTPTTSVSLSGTVGIRSRISLSALASTTIGAEFTAAYTLTSGAFDPSAYAYWNLRFAVAPGLTLGSGANLFYNFRSQSLGYDLIGRLTYAVTPNVSVGSYVGFDGSVRFGFNLGFSIPN